jgi:hypothetical protein
MGGVGTTIQIAENSAAVGVELFPCWYDSALQFWFRPGSLQCRCSFTGACPLLS